MSTRELPHRYAEKISVLVVESAPLKTAFADLERNPNSIGLTVSTFDAVVSLVEPILIEMLIEETRDTINALTRAINDKTPTPATEASGGIAARRD